MDDPYSFIELHSGRVYVFAKPALEMVELEDIAHALSNICRFTGHITTHYSVACHSILVASLVPEQYRLQALLHDATEAYVGDVATPLKRLLGETYSKHEDNARRIICKKFNIDFKLPEIVKRADRHALYLEAKYLFKRDGRPLPAYWEIFKQDDMPDRKPITYKASHMQELAKNIFMEEVKKYELQRVDQACTN